jgi:hypothetical protein
MKIFEERIDQPAMTPPDPSSPREEHGEKWSDAFPRIVIRFEHEGKGGNLSLCHMLPHTSETAQRARLNLPTGWARRP